MKVIKAINILLNTTTWLNDARWNKNVVDTMIWSVVYILPDVMIWSVVYILPSVMIMKCRLYPSRCDDMKCRLYPSRCDDMKCRLYPSRCEALFFSFMMLKRHLSPSLIWSRSVVGGGPTLEVGDWQHGCALFEICLGEGPAFEAAHTSVVGEGPAFGGCAHF
jgi:hypothetical protein